MSWRARVVEAYEAAQCAYDAKQLKTIIQSFIRLCAVFLANNQRAFATRLRKFDVWRESIIVAVSCSRTTLIIAEATLLAGTWARIDAQAWCRWCEARAWRRWCESRAPLVVDICKSCCSRRQLAAVGVGERVRNRSCLLYAAAGGDRRCGGGGGFATGEQTSTSTIVTHATRR